ncbi:MAG: ubiquinone/menaquinone biosynthesis methyltransferase [Candidatus Acidiferrales bacterium]|jgi:demethylmenaquinone methyltransferase / 2-methoxy-6-polyprenyl-1,4-benzoquinol methylase
MKTPAERQDLGLMREMFGTIAPRYDFMTRVLSYGMDGRWKRLGVENAALPDNPVVLDLAAGTGDFSKLLLRRLPRARAVVVDLTEPMLQQARARGLKETACADAAALPFADGSFDCVFVGYGLRNFPCLATALREIERVTRPGGLLVALDFFLPPNRALRQAYLGYLYAQGAFWGTVLHGRPRTYTYIPDSLRSFVSLGEFSTMLGEIGYERVDTRSFIFGGIGLHWAVKR